MEKSVDEIVAFYAELRKAADSFRGSVTAVYSRYTEGLQRVEDTRTTKTVWKQFSREEKKNVENIIIFSIERFSDWCVHEAKRNQWLHEVTLERLRY